MTNAVITAQQGSTTNSAGFKNRVINGDMRIDQRNTGASVTSVIGSTFSCDRHQLYSGVNAGKFTGQQNLNSVTPPSGFKNYLGVSSTAASSLGATESLAIVHHIEGYNIADFDWGLSTAKTATLSFWVYCNLSGTFGGTIRNSPGNRTYPYSFTIPTTNTWTYITITVPGDTTGTWYSDNRSGIQIWINLGTGTSLQGPANSWSAGDYRSPTGVTNLVGTSGAVMYVTGLQFEIGSSATGFDYRDYGRELIMCQRYYEILNGNNGGLWAYANSASILTGSASYLVQKRATPTVIYSSVTRITTPAIVDLTGVYNVLTYGAIQVDRLTYYVTISSGTSPTAGQMYALSGGCIIYLSSEL